MQTAQDKAREAATVIYSLDRLQTRYEGQEKAAITMVEVKAARNLIWSLLERITGSAVCQNCESHPSFDLDQWLFVESRDKPLAAAAAVNLVKEAKNGEEEKRA